MVQDRLSIVQDVNGRYLESVAEEIISPGHLVKRSATGGVVRHNESHGIAQVMIAIEDQYRGYDIDLDYAPGDVVNIRLCLPGDRVLAIVTAGPTYQVGQYLVSEGNGRLRSPIFAPGDDGIIGCVVEEITAVGITRALIEVM